MYKLTNSIITLEFDRDHGVITKFIHEKLQINLVGESRLAENFRLLLPLPHWRGHYIWGKEQKLDSCKITSNQAVLLWRGLQTKEGFFDIDVKLIVDLKDDDATFHIEIENRSDFIVEEVFTPALGGMNNPEEKEDWKLQYHQMWMAHERHFYRDFPHVGLGQDHPLWLHMYDSLPWCDLYHEQERKGVYIGNHDLEPRCSMIAQQLFPNFAFDKRWPDPDEVDDNVPIGSTLAWVSFPFIPSGECWQGPPIVFHFHQGIWYAAADYYRKWFDTHFPFDKSQSWLYHEDAWQSTIISFPDDTFNYTFKDLPDVARHAKKYGIRVIQIDGWDIGGLDRGFPDYRPDPRLGTKEELEAAISECEEMGVHFLMFGNIQVANLETDWFKEELYQYTQKDYWGNEPGCFGWGYHTCLGFAGPAASKQVVMDVTTKFKDIMLEQLRNMADMGPAGLQLDKTNALHGMSYGLEKDKDVAFRRELINMMAETKAYGQQRNPDFHLATEAWLDRMVPIIDAAYTRFFDKDHVPVFEYVFPEYRMTNCLMAIDYGLINNCVRYGHIINMEAKNLHGTAVNEQKMSQYTEEVLKIRRRLKEVLWYGRLEEPLKVKADNEKIRFSLFAAKKTNHHAVVLTHFERNEEKTMLSIEGKIGQQVRIHLPFQEVTEAVLPCTVAVLKNQLAVVEWTEG